MSFSYYGRIPSSKSLLNRLLVIQSFEPALTIVGDSRADDVEKMRSGLGQLQAGQPIDCGAAGTTLRFLALRASRVPGRHLLTGSRRLFERPQEELVRTLEQLGRPARLTPEGLVVEGGEWRLPQDGLRVDRSRSSQFASAVLLSAWNLAADLRVRLEGEAVSDGYLEMTLQLVREAGMAVLKTEAGELVVARGAQVSAASLAAEIDLSSAFSVAALAAVGGNAIFLDWPEKSLQPDAIFPGLLARMGCTVEHNGSRRELEVMRPASGALSAIDVDLGSMPDLFPVLTVLCALAEGTSRLFGASHLVHKESNRLTKSAELARRLGAEVRLLEDGIEIRGISRVLPTAAGWATLGAFDPSDDHRLAMAAAVARQAGVEVAILHREVVQKSFPEFWAVAGPRARAPRTALIGHRGVGKSTCLARIERYFGEAGRGVRCFDLDREIEARFGRRISEIFAKDGEPEFRRLEREAFAQLNAETETSSDAVFVAFGAGFDPHTIPETWRALWIRRYSDEIGRIFLDRPRLEDALPPLEEFRKRALIRSAVYGARADDTLWLEEGLEDEDPAERAFFLDELSGLGGAITVLPEHLRTRASAKDWIARRLAWGIDVFELRDDLLDAEQTHVALELVPHSRVLVSFRDPARTLATVALVEKHDLAFDWPLELGPCPLLQTPRILSMHKRAPGASLGDALAGFPETPPPGTLLKAALPTHDFHELALGHNWSKTAGRAFLPHSGDGRWSWYRLHTAVASPLCFIRDGDGSGADQPRLLAWVRRRLLPASTFAAVLGDPVAHSRTPMEQAWYFSADGRPTYAIRMSRDEWRSGAIDIVGDLGLAFAAVTAPLKDLAAETSGSPEPSINTLAYDDRRWRGANTDRPAFRIVIDGLRGAAGGTVDGTSAWSAAAVWGGGGTLPIIASALPEAEYFSARSGENRRADGPKAVTLKPDLLVWAAGTACPTMPPESWRPRWIVDLSYTEDSPAREFAQRFGSRYVSGLAMFKAQAAMQREFWSTLSIGEESQ